MTRRLAWGVSEMQGWRLSTAIPCGPIGAFWGGTAAPRPPIGVRNRALASAPQRRRTLMADPFPQRWRTRTRTSSRSATSRSTARKHPSLPCTTATVASSPYSSPPGPRLASLRGPRKLWFHALTMLLTTSVCTCAGSSVARFAGDTVHHRLAANDLFKNKDYEAGLKRAFLETDEDLRASA